MKILGVMGPMGVSDGVKVCVVSYGVSVGVNNGQSMR